MMMRNAQAPTDSTSQTESMSANDSQTGQVSRQSLRSLLTLGGNQNCEFTDVETGSSGQVYISGGKMRSDITTQVQGTSMAAHTISDGQTIYVWTEGQTDGFKMTLDATQPTGAPSDPASKNVDLDRQVDYECNTWSPDSSLFTLPAGIEFKDFSSMLAVPTGTGAAMDKCSACDSLSGDVKTQCLQALGC